MYSFWSSSKLSVRIGYFFNQTNRTAAEYSSRWFSILNVMPAWQESLNWAQMTWPHFQKKKKKNITKANKKTFQNLDCGTRQRVTQPKLLFNSAQLRFHVSYRRGLVISCTVISYFISTLTATWLPQASEPDTKPIIPRGPRGRQVTSVNAAQVGVRDPYSKTQ